MPLFLLRPIVPQTTADRQGTSLIIPNPGLKLWAESFCPFGAETECLTSLLTSKRLVYRPVTGTTELLSIGIARATKGDVTPAGEKFREIMRQTSAAREMPNR